MRVEAVADARGVPGDRVEDALEVRRRRRHGAQDLRRRGLLVPGLAEGSLRRRGLPGPSRVARAEQQDGAGGERQAEREQEDDARVLARPADLR